LQLARLYIYKFRTKISLTIYTQFNLANSALPAALVRRAQILNFGVDFSTLVALAESANAQVFYQTQARTGSW
jgi:hypothetical protein